MDSGTADHVLPETTETIIPCVKLERKTSPQKFVAVNGEQSRDVGEKRTPFKTKESASVHNVQKCGVK